MRSPVIGVLALQGDFREHLEMLAGLGVDARNVRTPEQVAACDGLILPGGESTTIGKLMRRYGVDQAIRELHAAGRPIWGTCAGAILLSREVVENDVHNLGLLDARIARNAYGRQTDSFERGLAMAALGAAEFPAVFIRAPRFVSVGPGVEALAAIDDEPVFVRQGNLLASTFHPELTSDPRVHAWLAELARA
ncbi:MAG: pyridoxal 5'-phosphate synthase glutaminase subunit PdxT [Fimbriimonadaceae bacterium]|nr:pyridoxal 5'-phosphate synthase glutaminase subunit PdxT [Fimbriimonadaceae bacterium]